MIEERIVVVVRSERTEKKGGWKERWWPLDNDHPIVQTKHIDKFRKMLTELCGVSKELLLLSLVFFCHPLMQLHRTCMCLSLPLGTLSDRDYSIAQNCGSWFLARHAHPPARRCPRFSPESSGLESPPCTVSRASARRAAPMELLGVWAHMASWRLPQGRLYILRGPRAKL
jgi:hypothetical protein